MAKKLIIDWDTYNKSIDNLAVQISDSGFKPSFIICIACLLYTSPSPRD